MGRFNRFLLIFALPAILMLVVGCQKLTHKRFQLIREGVSNQLEVEKTLGQPDRKLADLWNWTDHDRHLTCNIYFDDRGVVAKKEWIDATKGVWEGSAPGVDQPGEPSEQKIIIRTIEP